MQIGIRNTLSMISISAMPSIPSDQAIGPPSDQYSTNCHCGPPVWNAAHIAPPMARLASVAMSAIQRAPLALRNSAITPATSGTAIRMERNGRPLTMPTR